VVSKASDVAAVGAVAGVAYAEIAVKQGSQADTYSSAANIQKTAAQLSYVTGAADFSMGAFAYVAQKKKLEQMKSTITGSEGGVKASSDPAVTNALTNAVEAAKKAAYNHMMWGAGKLAAGYGMMYVAKKSQQQAANMGEIQADKDVIAALQAQQAQQVAGATSPTPGAPGSAAGGAAPFYQNNNPTFTIPGNTAQGASSPASNSASNGGTGSSTGGSSPLAGLTSSPAAAARSPASSGGLLGSSSASSAPGSEGTKSESATDPGQQKAAKEAIGNSFEMQLTGGMHAFAGGGSSASGGKDDVPNIASLMGSMGETKTAGTGLSPNALFAAGTEGTDGREQGSMSGVSAKSEISLFDITKAKITKMFEVGNVGIPKDVQVKN
jgi:hypothetical protein